MLRGKVAHQALYAFYTRPAEGARRRARRRPTNLDAGARASSSACLDEALRGGVRLELGEVAGGRAARGAPARPRAVRRARRRASPLDARAAPVRGRLRHRPLGARAAARARARRRPLRQRQDRPDRHRPVQRARDRAGLQVGQGLVLGGADRRRAAAPGAALHARAARPRRDRAARRRLPRALGRRAARAACCAPRRATTCRASSRSDYLDEEAFWGAGRDGTRPGAARRAADPGAATSRTTRSGGECPSWCDLWTMCRVARA